MNVSAEFNRCFQYILDPWDNRHLKPGFLIIGAQKAGTTSLFYYLSEHPDIDPPSVKEICFFNIMPNYNKGLRWYHRHFPRRNRSNRNQATFEASVGYATFGYRTPERIYRYNPELKLILIVRDPVERAFSQWNMGRNMAETDPSSRHAEYRDFDEVIASEIELFPTMGARLKYIPLGLYIRQIENYLRFFPRKQLLVLESNRLKNERIATLNRTLEFLELSPYDWEIGKLQEKFKADYRHSAINEDTARALADFYRPYNERLFEFLGERFDWR